MGVWLCLLSMLSHNVQKTMGYLTGPQGGVVVVLEGLVILTFHTEKLRLRDMTKVTGLTSGSLTSMRTL